jgi:hypothetical protein
MASGSSKRCFSPVRTRSMTPASRPSGSRVARTTKVTLLAIASSVFSSTRRMVPGGRQRAVKLRREKSVKVPAPVLARALAGVLASLRRFGVDS